LKNKYEKQVEEELGRVELDEQMKNNNQDFSFRFILKPDQTIKNLSK
jgi:hypothetical protein